MEATKVTNERGAEASTHAGESKSKALKMRKAAANSKKGSGEQHAALQDRVDYLEKHLGHSTDMHTLWEQTHADHAKLQQGDAARGEHHAALQERMEYVEKMLGDILKTMPCGQVGFEGFKQFVKPKSIPLSSGFNIGGSSDLTDEELKANFEEQDAEHM